MTTNQLQLVYSPLSQPRHDCGKPLAHHDGYVYWAFKMFLDTQEVSYYELFSKIKACLVKEQIRRGRHHMKMDIVDLS